MHGLDGSTNSLILPPFLSYNPVYYTSSNYNVQKVSLVFVGTKLSTGSRCQPTESNIQARVGSTYSLALMAATKSPYLWDQPTINFNASEETHQTFAPRKEGIKA